MRAAIGARNDAESSLKGRAARLSARLHAFGSTGQGNVSDRTIQGSELLAAMSAGDEDRLVQILERATAIGLQ